VVAEALRGADAVEEYNVNIGGQPYAQHSKQYKRKRLEVWNSDDGWERRRAAPCFKEQRIMFFLSFTILKLLHKHFYAYLFFTCTYLK